VIKHKKIWGMNVLCDALLVEEERGTEADKVLLEWPEEADDWDGCAELEEWAEDEDDDEDAKKRGRIK
jgi:hypothetical protein